MWVREGSSSHLLIYRFRQYIIPGRLHSRGGTGTVQSLRQSAQIVLHDVVPHHDTSLLETRHQDSWRIAIKGICHKSK